MAGGRWQLVAQSPRPTNSAAFLQRTHLLGEPPIRGGKSATATNRGHSVAGKWAHLCARLLENAGPCAREGARILVERILFSLASTTPRESRP